MQAKSRPRGVNQRIWASLPGLPLALHAGRAAKPPNWRLRSGRGALARSPILQPPTPRRPDMVRKLQKLSQAGLIGMHWER